MPRKDLQPARGADRNRCNPSRAAYYTMTMDMGLMDCGDSDIEDAKSFYVARAKWMALDSQYKYERQERIDVAMAECRILARLDYFI